MAAHSGGAKIGPRIANLVSQSIVYTHKQLLGTKHKLAMLIFEKISDEISREVDDTLGSVFSQLLAHHGPESDMHGALDFLANGHGQLKAISGSSLLTQGLMSSVAAVVNNKLARGVYDQISPDPNLNPDAGTAATLAAQGWISGANGVQTIRENGYNTAWADAMIASSKTWPDASLLMRLVRRRLISNEDFHRYMLANGYDATTADVVLKEFTLPLDPAEAALAVLRGNMSFDDGVQVAVDNGMEAADFNTIVNNTGEPLGLEQLLEAYRRGFIDQERLRNGILQSRVRDEWIDVAEQLRYVPMSTADAVNGAVQGHLSYDAAQSLADQNGLEPGQFDTLYQTAGEPLSRTELEELFNRGLIDQATVEQGLRESRLKDKYVADAFALHDKLLEPRMLSDAVVYGALSHQDAVRAALDYGFSATHAEVMVSSSSLRKLQTRKEKLASAAEAMYMDAGMSVSELTDLLTSLGYEQEEIVFMVRAADMHRGVKLLSGAISSVRSRFVGRHIDESRASALLDAAGVPSAQRDVLLHEWSDEVAANVRTLTPAQVVKAAALGLISGDEAMSRLVDLGYSETDAGLLLGGA